MRRWRCSSGSNTSTRSGLRGWTVVEVDSADDHPDGVFIEDTLAVFGDLVVVCRLGAETRRGETDTARTAASGLGRHIVEIAEEWKESTSLLALPR